MEITIKGKKVKDGSVVCRSGHDARMTLTKYTGLTVEQSMEVLKHYVAEGIPFCGYGLAAYRSK